MSWLLSGSGCLRFVYFGDLMLNLFCVGGLGDCLFMVVVFV